MPDLAGVDSVIAAIRPAFNAEFAALFYVVPGVAAIAALLRIALNLNSG